VPVGSLHCTGDVILERIKSPGSYAVRIALWIVGKPEKVFQRLLIFVILQYFAMYLHIAVAGCVSFVAIPFLCTQRKGGYMFSFSACVACSRNKLVSDGFDILRCGKSVLHADRISFRRYRVTLLSDSKKTDKYATQHGSLSPARLFFVSRLWPFLDLS
jgi:hypothetical protein